MKDFSKLLIHKRLNRKMVFLSCNSFKLSRVQKFSKQNTETYEILKCFYPFNSFEHKKLLKSLKLVGHETLVRQTQHVKLNVSTQLVKFAKTTKNQLKIKFEAARSQFKNAQKQSVVYLIKVSSKLLTAHLTF